MEDISGTYGNPMEEPADITISVQAQEYLRQAGSWTKFLGIIAFIGTFFILMGALFAGTMMGTMARFSPAYGAIAGLGGIIAVVYLAIAAVSFFFGLYLYQFGDRVKRSIAYGSTAGLTDALGKLKSFFKLWGIFTIAFIALYIIFIIAAIVGASALAGAGRM